MTDDTQKAEEMLQQSSDQTRTSSEPVVTTERADEEHTLNDALLDAFRRADDGDLSPNLGIRDQRLAALLAALEETGELEDLGTDVQEALDEDPDPEGVSKSSLLSDLARLALEEVRPDLLDDAKDAYAEHLASQADNF